DRQFLSFHLSTRKGQGVPGAPLCSLGAEMSSRPRTRSALTDSRPCVSLWPSTPEDLIPRLAHSRTPLALSLLVALLAAVLVRALGPGNVRLDLGAFEGSGRGSGWSRAQRASLDPPATTDGVV